MALRAHTNTGEEGGRNNSKILENFEGITEGKGPSYSLPVPRVSPCPFLSLCAAARLGILEHDARREN